MTTSTLHHKYSSADRCKLTSHVNLCADDVLEGEEEEEARGGQGYSYDDLAAAMGGDEELLDDGGPNEDAEGQCMGGVSWLMVVPYCSSQGPWAGLWTCWTAKWGGRARWRLDCAETWVWLMLRPAAGPSIWWPIKTCITVMGADNGGDITSWACEGNRCADH